MKTSLISLIALGVAAAMAGPADRAVADEPTVLTDAQRDRVTTGDSSRSSGDLNKNSNGNLNKNRTVGANGKSRNSDDVNLDGNLNGNINSPPRF